jgi:hypothetical protein
MCGFLRGKGGVDPKILLYLDAANDSHSGLAIYDVLIQKALNLTPRAEPEWFSFDAINGVLRDRQGYQWFPFNPHYDPGPLPSPQVPYSNSLP